MFEDKISKNEKLEINDIVYIYEYKERNIIENFDDLKKVKIINILPTTSSQKEQMVTGITEKYTENGNVLEDKITGFVVYKQNGNFIETSEGTKYISYFMKNNKCITCLKKIKNNKNFIKLRLILSLQNIAEFSIPIFSDMLFISEQDVDNFTKNLKFKKGEFSQFGINIKINDKNFYFSNFDVYINDKCYNFKDIQKQIFEYCCNNLNSKNKTIYDYNKTFSLKAVAYEYDNIYL